MLWWLLFCFVCFLKRERLIYGHSQQNKKVTKEWKAKNTKLKPTNLEKKKKKVSEGLCDGGWWLEQDCGSQPMRLVPAAGGQQTSLPRCTRGVRVHLLSNSTLEQPLSRGSMKQVREAGMWTGVLGGQRGHAGAWCTHECACAGELGGAVCVPAPGSCCLCQPESLVCLSIPVTATVTLPEVTI